MSKFKKGDKIRCIRTNGGCLEDNGFRDKFVQGEVYTVTNTDPFDKWDISIGGYWTNSKHFEPAPRIGYYLGHGSSFNHLQASFTVGKAYELTGDKEIPWVIGNDGLRWGVPADWFSDTPPVPPAVRDVVDAIRCAYEGIGPAVTIVTRDERPRATSVVELLRKHNHATKDPFCTIVIHDDYSGHLETFPSQRIYDTGFQGIDGTHGLMALLRRRIEEAR